MAAVASGVVRCSCVGLGALYRWRQQQTRRGNQRQRYLPVKQSLDRMEEDDEDFEDDEEPVVEEEEEEVDDLLDMPGSGAAGRISGENSIFQIQSLTSTGSTPAGRPSTAALSATSANWVDEMNAELAEFDALAATLVKTPGGGASSSSRK